ncbi:MAG: 1-deoxy-D-xylulose-5-phosphate reductoisomerase [Bacteroidaceae bacterium]|nr:1-deoxy-D-xylulose-5-phosphate reductoisomerase [Bacteroidales bacterium]MBQ3623307.1 1-deoxy-D-xylulose-5-phosphate reductoisomerase [Bacteroidaceae bacterium]MBR7134046.1 1-deoxy-D-xylulose-5-phosphate reductoisomerase [Bacteroidaceae bacterium]
MNNTNKRTIAILGSTGSIGTQTLQVVEEHPDLFEVYAITAGSNVERLIEQAHKFNPEAVVIADESKYETLKEALADKPIKIYAGYDSICQIVKASPIDIVVTAMVGFSGLRPTIEAIKAGKAIALANKETLVVAGEYITQLAIEHKVPLLPVDSEHSAIFQCLAGETNNGIEKIILTASGGPFRTMSMEQLEHVTKKEALRHPNWSMGAKITIDSASMMNKGFEVIEAKWLFGLNADKIDVVVHPQSVIHSMVQFADGAVKAQLGTPDMRLPIMYALSYPTRLASSFDRLDFEIVKELTFEKPDTERFPNLRLAYEALAMGGNMPCVVNAANEVCVAAFLADKIKFTDMSRLIERAMQSANYTLTPTIEDYFDTDADVRKMVENWI